MPTKDGKAGTEAVQVAEMASVPIRKERSETELMELAKRFVDTLAGRYVGRDEEAKVIALGLISGMPVLFIGEPGTAKSALVRDAAKLISAKYFPYQINKYTDPSELFGPIDIVKLKDEGKYQRITTGKLPEAEIAYLDEIFNANSSILNTLLSILEERVFYDGYTGERKINLHTVMCATNNIPDEKELDALYDRLLIRHIAKPVSEDRWSELVEMTAPGQAKRPPLTPMISIDDLRRLSGMARPMDEVVRAEYLKILKIMEDQGIHMTDRRKVQAQLVISANALLGGRERPEIQDLMVLKYIAPKLAEDFEKVNALLVTELKLTEKYMFDLKVAHENIRKTMEEAKRKGKAKSEVAVKELGVVKTHLRQYGVESNDPTVVAYADKIIKEIDDFLKEG